MPKTSLICGSYRWFLCGNAKITLLLLQNFQIWADQILRRPWFYRFSDEEMGKQTDFHWLTSKSCILGQELNIGKYLVIRKEARFLSPCSDLYIWHNNYGTPELRNHAHIRRIISYAPSRSIPFATAGTVECNFRGKNTSVRYSCDSSTVAT